MSAANYLLKTENFIIKAKQKHGDKYDYSSVLYTKATEKVKIGCKKCGNKWLTLPHNHLKGSGCKKCKYKELPQNQAKSHDDFLKEAQKIHGDKFEYLSEYKNKITKIKLRCKKCKKILHVRAQSHLEGYGCKKCQYKKLPQNQPMQVQLFEERCKKIHDNKYEYFQDYRGNKYKIKILCKIHNECFYQTGGAHLFKEQGCPKCNCSRGETKIEKYLKENNIKYIYEKTFAKCKNKKLLSFDFYLLEHNVCIEFDGKLHYYPVAKFGGLSKLTAQQKNDSIKTQFCLDNNIRLLRIPFFEINNIEKIIGEFLNDKSYS